ncbi:GNAT family N-acetyltransferase [Undibacterium umbellatum]|uniref:GNAT family N-acetyltransferase n=1 Tax=Undibacterium umbellatum TaxID=2762300 RepID=UPI001C9B8D70|nr:GNAT family N-acetyltransferase [Undibacterium umbellatum]
MKVQADLSKLSTRRAVRQDLPRLLELIADDDLGKNREGVGSEDACYSEAFDRITTDDNQFLMVAELDGRIIAMQQVTFIPGLSRKGATRTMIESVRVDGYLRGQGIGHWFIKQAIQLASERGCQLVQLTSDKKRIQAHRFYGSLGFTASHEGFKLQL